MNRFPNFGPWDSPESFQELIAKVNGHDLILHAEYISTDYSLGSSLYHIVVELDENFTTEIRLANLGSGLGESSRLEFTNFEVLEGILYFDIYLALGTDTNMKFIDLPNPDLDIFHSVDLPAPERADISIYGKKHGEWHKAKKVFANKDGFWYEVGKAFGNKDGWKETK